MTGGGNLTVSGLSNLVIDGNTAGNGISISGASFDAIPGGAFDTVSGGAMVVGSSGNPVGGAGVSLSGAAGDYAIGSLTVFAGTSGVTVGGTGLFGGSSGMRLTNGGGSISAPAGVGLSVSDTTVDAANLNFTSISSSGGANGILLQNTGTAGSLVVSGTGAANSGGIIQNTSSHGISLTQTSAPSFNNVGVQNTFGSGVKGTQVTGFAFTNGSINSSGTGLGVNESNIAFNTVSAGTENNLSGAVVITGNMLTNAYYHGVDIFNFSGTLADVNVSGNTITSGTTTAVSKGSAIRLIAFGSATGFASVTKATLANNVINNFPSGSGIVAQGGNANLAGSPSTFGVAGHATNVIAITSNRIAGLSPAVRMAINAIQASVNGKGQGNFNISNNGTVAEPLRNITGNVITNSAIGQVTVTSVVSNNHITANHTAGVGGSFGISAGVDNTFGITDAPSLTLTVSDNVISQTDSSGIMAAARNSNGVLRLMVTDNTVSAPLSGFRSGIRVDSGSALGNTNVCLNISGNTSAGSGGSQGIGIRKQGTNPAVNVFGVNGMVATSSPGVEAYIDSLNPAGGGTLLISATSGFTNCSLP